MPFRNLANFDDIDDIDQLRDYYYRTVSETIQTKCSFLKRIGGKWKSSCGFLEDEKSICTDTLEYQTGDADYAIINADDAGEERIFRRREVLLRNGLSAI